MTPGARLAAAIDVLAASETDSRPTERLLQTYFRERRYAGARDRRAVAGDVFDILRARARLDWWIRRAGAIPGPRTRALAHLGLIGGLDADAIARLFTEDAHAPGATDETETILAGMIAGLPLDHPDMPAWTRHEYPPWLEPALRAGIGPDYLREADALNRPASVDLRVNALSATRSEAAAALAAEGIACQPTALSPWGLRCAAGTALDRTRAFQDGWIDVQDESSQVAVLLVQAQPGQTVVDYCAGAGGKTLALAAQLGGRGRLVAFDTDPQRLLRMSPRLRRAGAGGVETHVLLDRPLVAAPQPVAARTADRVLVDAPCSGTGTWRRDPLLRWRLTPDILAGHVARQKRILGRAAQLVRPGGLLIYATCSVLPDENEDVVAAFAAEHADFASVPVGAAWTLAAPCPAAPESPIIRLTPLRTGTDGFSIGILRRAQA